MTNSILDYIGQNALLIAIAINQLIIAFTIISSLEKLEK